MEFTELSNPQSIGLKIINNFVAPNQIDLVHRETSDPEKVQWLDAHETYENMRGLTIIQNHYTYALKLSHGDQSFLNNIPETVSLYKKTEQFIRGMSSTFPSLAGWQADELSFHLYDNKEVGLSAHKDNIRFIGLVAILSIDGDCDLVVTHEGEDIAIEVVPGDLCILRAPGLIETDNDPRPEHSVRNLRTDTRLSMVLRANNRPDDSIPGFKFNNWPS